MDKESPRVAVFRTHTVQNPKSNYLCPYPNVLPDSNQRLPQEQFVEHSLSKTLEHAGQLIQSATECLSQFSRLREAKNKDIQLREDKEKEQIRKLEEMNDNDSQINSSSMPGTQSINPRHEEEKRQEENSAADNNTSQRQRQNNLYLTKADHEQEIIFAAA